MIDVHCSGHGARVLLGARAITALVDTADGIALLWTCRCGTRGVERRQALAPAAPGRVRPVA